MYVNKKNIVAIDIETTGIDIYNDEILQVAIIDGNYNILFHSYIKPLIKKSWPAAEKINKISYNMVQNSPCFSDVANKIYFYLNNAELIVGYNHERFDLPFVQQKIGKIISNDTFDVMKCYSKFINKKYQKLKDCCNFFNIINKKEHDSLGDAAVTLACFYKLIEVDEKCNITICDY